MRDYKEIMEISFIQIEGIIVLGMVGILASLLLNRLDKITNTSVIKK